MDIKKHQDHPVLCKLREKSISTKWIYVRRTRSVSRLVASALCVPCSLTVRRTFSLIPCAWCLPTPLSPLPCTQRSCCSRPPSQHPPHAFLFYRSRLTASGVPIPNSQQPDHLPPTFSLRRPKSAPWCLKSSGSFRRGCRRATFSIFSYWRTTHRGITIVILFLFTTLVLSTNCI